MSHRKIARQKRRDGERQQRRFLKNRRRAFKRAGVFFDDLAWLDFAIDVSPAADLLVERVRTTAKRCRTVAKRGSQGEEPTYEDLRLFVRTLATLAVLVKTRYDALAGLLVAQQVVGTADEEDDFEGQIAFADILRESAQVGILLRRIRQRLKSFTPPPEFYGASVIVMGMGSNGSGAPMGVRRQPRSERVEPSTNGHGTPSFAGSPH